MPKITVITCSCCSESGTGANVVVDALVDSGATHLFYQHVTVHQTWHKATRGPPS